jgi:transposase-like protein
VKTNGKRTFTEDYRVKVVKEALETGETGLVARRYDLHPNLVSRWIGNFKKYGKTTVYNNTSKTDKDPEKQILQNENENLKKLLGEKELEIQILRDLLKKTNQDLEID